MRSLTEHRTNGPLIFSVSYRTASLAGLAALAGVGGHSGTQNGTTNSAWLLLSPIELPNVQFWTWDIAALAVLAGTFRPGCRWRRSEDECMLGQSEDASASSNKSAVVSG